MATNLLVLQGEVEQIAALRYTPAGIPLLSFSVRHTSEQIEANMQRKVECDVSVIAMSDLALRSQDIKPGVNIRVTGFLARRSLKSTQLVLHINALEII
ncbi:MAG: primosomal replication protein N [Methylophilaceae bacterium]|nr:primosomal replication protein N [Methylophilaceae bacterium]